MKSAEHKEEALEKLWEVLEEGSGPKASEENLLPPALEISIDRLVQEGLLARAGGVLRFTATGKQEAAQAIRRHRLSERLFHDIIETDQETMEEAA